MSDNNFVGCPKSVPIKVNKIFDSCSDKDCFNDLAIILDIGELPPNIRVVKNKCVRVTDICMNVEPIPFNKGFYSIDLTYTFRVELYGYEKACDTPVLLTGTTYASKNCILYGGEANTKTFFSNADTVGSNNACCEIVNPPTVSIQVVEPIALETKVGKVCCGGSEHAAEDTNFCCRSKWGVIMTLGLFSVVEISRPVTVLVPTYEYTIPHKECSSESDTPCEVFDKLKFPVEEFSPLTIDATDDCGCGS